jgi:hypothetical protein
MQHAGDATPWMAPCITSVEPYVTKSFDVTIPAILKEREAAKTLAIIPEPVLEDVVEEEEADEEEEFGEGEGMDEAAAPGAEIDPDALERAQPAPWPHCRQEVVDSVPAGGGFVRQTRRMSIFVAPLALAVAAVVLFWLGLGMIWRQPAPGEAELPTTDKIDLTPSPVVRVWGVLILFAVGVLYWLFF